MSTVTIEIEGGPSISVPWRSGLTAHGALESAVEAGGFTCGIQYYPSVGGYLVSMVNESYDTFLTTVAPYFYWEFLHNGAPASEGIDHTILSGGDVVRFSLVRYDRETHKGTLIEAKHAFGRQALGHD